MCPRQVQPQRCNCTRARRMSSLHWIFLLGLMTCWIHMVIGHDKVKVDPSTSTTSSSSSSSVLWLHPKTFHVQDLWYGDDHSDNELRSVLSSLGLLAIRVPSLRKHREAALDGICRCHQLTTTNNNKNNKNDLDSSIQSVYLSDGTLRTTIATSTFGVGNAIPLDKDLSTTCGIATIQAMEDVRVKVSQVTQAFVHALDRLLQQQQQQSPRSSSSSSSSSSTSSSSLFPLLRDSYNRIYPTVSSIQASAVHLEHFHVYQKATTTTTTSATPTRKTTRTTTTDTVHDLDWKNNHNNKEEPQQPKKEHVSHNKEKALDWHTDAGLFLSFVPAWNCASAAAAVAAQGGHPDKDNNNHNNHNGKTTPTNHDDNDSSSLSASSSSSSSFWILDEEGRQRPVQLPTTTTTTMEDEDDFIMIMMGIGAERWLGSNHHNHGDNGSSSSSSSSSGQHHHLHLHATRHAVQLQPGQERAWYGMST